LSQKTGRFLLTVPQDVAIGKKAQFK